CLRGLTVSGCADQARRPGPPVRYVIGQAFWSVEQGRLKRGVRMKDAGEPALELIHVIARSHDRYHLVDADVDLLATVLPEPLRVVLAVLRVRVDPAQFLANVRVYGVIDESHDVLAPPHRPVAARVPDALQARYLQPELFREHARPLLHIICDERLKLE